jgi:protein-lysine methyltransferase-like protein
MSRCDIVRTRTAILEDLVSRSDAGGLTLPHEEKPVTDGVLAREILSDRLDRRLQGLVKAL